MRRMELFDCTVPVFIKHLRSIDLWIDKAVAHAEAKKFDPEILMAARLAPDQFSFLRQVTAACDTAKWTAAKLAGKQGPAHPDTEVTIAELRARVATVVTYLETFTREDFAGAEQRMCQHSWMGTKSVRGDNYVREFGWPNFYFHTTSAYQILRHNGVELSKQDYIAHLSLE